MLTNIAVPGALGKIGKSARIVERLEDLTDTLKKLDPNQVTYFCIVEVCHIANIAPTVIQNTSTATAPNFPWAEGLDTKLKDLFTTD